MNRNKPEQIVTLLRQIAVEIANGKNTPQAYPDAEAGPNQTMETVSEEKQTEALVAELCLEKQILKDVAEGSFLSPECRRGAVEHARRKYRGRYDIGLLGDISKSGPDREWRTKAAPGLCPHIFNTIMC